MTTTELRDRIEREATIEVDALPEDAPVRGNAMASGDDEYDRQVEDNILAKLEYEPWAWCTVRVRGQWRGLSADDYLGCCSYDGETDFTGPSNDYYDQMRQTVIDGLYEQAMEIIDAV